MKTYKIDPEKLRRVLVAGANTTVDELLAKYNQGGMIVAHGPALECGGLGSCGEEIAAEVADEILDA